MERPSDTSERPADLKGPPPASPSLEAGLYVVSTPIGNLRDITLRAIDVLSGANLVLAEDTRVTRKLLAAHGIDARLTSFHDHNEDAVRPRVLAAIAEGAAVALVSDAGTPLVSDPGYKLVRAALAAGARVIPVPGASAVLAGLVGSGLPPDRFLFAGFAPSKAGAREAFFREFVDVPATLVFYETGPRLKSSLESMATVFGDREASVGRELTKFFEETRRGTLTSLAAAIDAAPKGEIVVMVAPPHRDQGAPDEAAIDAALRDALEKLSVRDAAALVAEDMGLPRREVYARALKLRTPE